MNLKMCKIWSWKEGKGEREGTPREEAAQEVWISINDFR